MRGLQRCDHHEKAHEKAVHLPTSVTPGRPVEVPATQLHCPGLHFIYRRYQFEAPRYGDRASCSSCMLHPKRAFRSGGLDFFPLLINITTSGTSWPRQPTRIHHDAQVCRRLGVDNRGGWVTSTRITEHLLFIFISLYSSTQAVFQAQAICIQALALEALTAQTTTCCSPCCSSRCRLSHTVVVMFTGVCQQECPKVLW
jgi:hypothetical protein